MAGPLDFFSPGAWNDPNQPGIAQGFQTLLSDPRALAALGQMGQYIAGPREWGVSPAQQVIGSFGAAGQAVAREEEQQRKQTETESKAELRQAQAERAGARAGEEASRLELARERLGITKERNTAQMELWKSREDRLNRDYDSRKAVAEARLKLAETDQERKAARDEVTRLDKEHQQTIRDMRIEQQRQGLDIQTAREEGIRARSGLRGSIGLSQLYQTYKGQVEKYNQAIDKDIINY